MFLVAGAVISIAIALGGGLFVDFSAARNAQSARSYDGRVEWVLSMHRTLLGQRYTSQRLAGLAWANDQAAGAPDTIRQGDERTAWASASQDDQPEWLELQYPQPIRAIEIHIYESYNPGGVEKVTLFDEAGREIVSWEGKDPARPGTAVAVAKLPLSANVRTQRAKIYINSPAVAGWNEIDAVGLVDAEGNIHWAKRVHASSTYHTGAQPVTAGATPRVPRWTGLSQPTRLFRDEQVKRESRIVDGFGWPMPALRREVSDPRQRALPTWPIWGGLAIDTLVFAVVCALAWWLLTRPAKFLTESVRARRGCCLRCGYDLQYNLAAGCPECGWRRI